VCASRTELSAIRWLVVTFNEDLSDKTQSATSFAAQVVLSFEVRKRELGGPIETEMTALFIMSSRSDTIRCRASGDSGAAEEYRSDFLDSTHLNEDFFPGT
jgi:hypothetical protein